MTKAVLGPVDLVLASARALLFVREEPRNSNRGQGVEAMLKTTSLGPGYPWCAAYVAYAGRAAMGAGWPLPLVAGCMSLRDFAERQGWLRTTPERGDVFLTWDRKLGRYAHTGFVTDVLANGVCATLEGNTNDGGSRDGWGVFARQRTFGVQDRFIRWTEAVR